MTKTITIEPITRIEGHAKVSIQLGKDGKVQDAKFHNTQFRGFEKFAEGRPFHEMPSLTARTCGICPVSHLVASGKACDQILSVRIPATAKKLRRILNLGQLIQSHALNFFHLSSPDLLLGMDSDPAQRHIFGVLEKYPDMAKDGIRMRRFGQQVIEWLSGKRIHPAWVVPGGVSAPMSEEVRDRILADIPEVRDVAVRTLDWYKQTMNEYREHIRTFGNFPSLFLGLVGEKGSLEHYDGKIRVVNSGRQIVEDGISPNDYADYIGEAVEPWTYLKFPFFKPHGYPDGMYRVGPLARLNIATECATPLANQELAEFHGMDLGAVLGSFHYHYARLIEILYGIEIIEALLNEPDITSKMIRAQAGVNSLEGIGVSEAPRGILIHHYKVNEQGLIEWANLIIATGHNNLAMNKAVLQVARQYVRSDALTEGALNRVEAVIRAFDPCLACSTHALGQMPLRVDLYGPDGMLVDTIARE
jgi:NAD-reducing hydrogenase large subunit